MPVPRCLHLLLAVALAVVPVAPGQTSGTSRSLPEIELRRIVERERLLLAQARDRPETVDEHNLQTQLQEVILDYEALLRRSPDFVPAYIAYGLLLGRVGQEKRAAEVFLTANKLEPFHAVVKNQLGNYCAEEGQFQEALSYYLAAVDLEPREPLYHYQLGTLLHEYREEFVRAGRFDDATVRRQSAAALRRAAELGPDNIAFAYRAAESFYDLPEPDWEAALAAWRELEQRVQPGIERQTVQLHQANILIRQGRFDEARPLLDGVTEPALEGNKKTLVARLPETAPNAP